MAMEYGPMLAARDILVHRKTESRGEKVSGRAKMELRRSRSTLKVRRKAVAI